MGGGQSCVYVCVYVCVCVREREREKERAKEKEREQESVRMCVCVCMYMCICVHVCLCVAPSRYGVATISRLLKIIGLFCRISSLLYGSFAKETYNFKEPTSRSHPI